MNHLAHALLSGSDDDLLLGGLLGDFCRGAPDPGWPDAVRRGVIMHRKIDVYTDGHPDVRAARALFDPPWRRYAGILVDLYFDHALARAWPRHGVGSLAAFSARTAATLDRHRDWLPADMNRFADYFLVHGLFGAYARKPVIEGVLGGISRRLRHANPLGEAGAVLWTQADSLDRAFESFFPQLETFAEALRMRLTSTIRPG